MLEFREQLAYLRRFYSPITIDELLNGMAKQCELPPNPLVLTFDDGFVDHFVNVFPLLHDAKIQGTFFVPAMPTVEKRVLDVHKIHFILAQVADERLIVEQICGMIDRNGSASGLQSAAAYYAQYAQPSRWDDADVAFIKKILQTVLPETVRHAIVAELFAKYVTVDEEAFASELYLTPDQMRCMRSMGMVVGGHGYTHSRLSYMTQSDQQLEISRSLEFLGSIGVEKDRWIMSYPYGDFNEELIESLQGAGCAAAFTTVVGLADLKGNPLLLSRIDTNDLPKKAGAPVAQWTAAAHPVACT